MRSFLRKHKEIFFIVPVLVWIGWILYGISHEKSTGATTQAELRDAAMSAIKSHDSDSLDQLFGGSEVGENYSKNYLLKLKTARAQDVRAAIADSGGRNALIVTATDSGGHPICTAWDIVHKKDSWTLDGAPPLTPWCAAR